MKLQQAIVHVSLLLAVAFGQETGQQQKSCHLNDLLNVTTAMPPVCVYQLRS